MASMPINRPNNNQQGHNNNYTIDIANSQLAKPQSGPND